MEPSTTATPVPHEQLKKLEFLVGESTAFQTLYPPDGVPVTYLSACRVSREACDRFLHLDIFGEIAGVGAHSVHAVLTYSSRKGCYEMWFFTSTSDEPMHLTGDFQGEKLILHSDPWSMPWGLQKFRITFTPLGDSVEYLYEVWEPDGFAKFSTVVFGRQSVRA